MLDRIPGSPSATARRAALLWLVVAGFAVLLAASPADEWETQYIAATIAGVVGGLLTATTISKLLARGGKPAGLTSPAVLLALAGVVLVGAIYWATPVWTVLFTAAALLTAKSLPDWLGRSRIGFWTLVAAWPASFGLFVLLDRVTFGPIDDYGDYPWAGGAGLVLWCLLFAASLALRASETESDPLPAAA